MKVLSDAGLVDVKGQGRCALIFLHRPVLAACLRKLSSLAFSGACFVRHVNPFPSHFIYSMSVELFDKYQNEVERWQS
jgi:hypothetical protein